MSRRSAWTRRLLVGLLSTASVWASAQPLPLSMPSSGGQPGNAGPAPRVSIRERIKTNLADARKKIDRYAALVERYRSGRASNRTVGAEFESQCAAQTKLSQVLSSPLVSDKSVGPAAQSYVTCLALSDNSTGDCALLSAGGTGAAPLSDACSARVAYLRFVDALISSSPQTAELCEQALSLAPGNPTNDLNLEQHLGSAGLTQLCARAAAGDSAERLVQLATSLSSPPFDAKQSKTLSTGLHQLLDRAPSCGTRCGESVSDGCCDMAALRRARVDGVAGCGRNSLCRAIITRKSDACYGLFTALTRIYCSESLQQEIKASPEAASRLNQNATISGLRQAYADAFDSLAQLNSAVDLIEPKSSPTFSEYRHKARELQKRLEDVPKWGGTSKRKSGQ
ncbi:MAG: hypothetical protein KGM24_01120 [Elusimicrobia bacterium]|nr:hypothetical protein [Elusimicrobiota bacterium]